MGMGGGLVREEASGTRHSDGELSPEQRSRGVRGRTLWRRERGEWKRKHEEDRLGKERRKRKHGDFSFLTDEFRLHGLCHISTLVV
jgi:hypothetical protein